jgi:hypothetical protein
MQLDFIYMNKGQTQNPQLQAMKTYITLVQRLI